MQWMSKRVPKCARMLRIGPLVKPKNFSSAAQTIADLLATAHVCEPTPSAFLNMQPPECLDTLQTAA